MVVIGDLQAYYRGVTELLRVVIEIVLWCYRCDIGLLEGCYVC